MPLPIPAPRPAAPWPAQHGVLAVVDWRELLGKVDLVRICSPAATHAAIVRDFLSAGTHVLVEKPIATTVDEADELVALAKKTGLILTVGHQERFVFSRTGLLDQKVKPLSIKCWRRGPWTGRGDDVSAVLDLMIHDLDLVHTLVKSPINHVSAEGLTQYGPHADEVVAVIKFADGTMARLDTSRVAETRKRGFRAIYADGVVEIDFLTRQVINTTPRPLEPLEMGDPLGESVAAFVAAVQGGDEPLVPAGTSRPGAGNRASDRGSGRSLAAGCRPRRLCAPRGDSITNRAFSFLRRNALNSGMTGPFRIALAQLNPVMGDIAGNLARAREARARVPNADVILFSELFIAGYPPEDLVLKPALQADARAAVEEPGSGHRDGGPAILIGAPWVERASFIMPMLLLDGGKIAGKSFKYELPNYGVFDEKRVFATGPLPGPLNVRGVKLGMPICEDIWKPDVAIWLADAGAEIFCGAQWLALRSGQGRCAAEAGGGARKRKRIAADLSQPGGRAGRARLDGASFVLNADR